MALPAHLPTWPNAVSIVLRPGMATPVLAGHPWLYSGAVAHVVCGPQTAIEPGVRCGVFDPYGRWLGLGYYNPQSQIAVRMVAHGRDVLEPQQLPTLGDVAVARVGQAVALRRDLGLPGPDTTAFRLLNADGDLLPGCTVDQYGDGAVVQVTAAGIWQVRAAVVQALLDQGLRWVCVRVPNDIHPAEGLPAGTQHVHGPVPGEVEVQLGGVRYLVEPGAGQKTGLYCDQRENHAAVAALARGAFAVDAFCHVGGFGLQAARAGARRVLCIDASQRAIDAVLRHAELNSLSVETQCGEAIHALRSLADGPESEKPDLVVVDPPKFATKASALDGAVHKYQALNAVAAAAVRDGGWLVSCSCSGLLEPAAFVRMIALAAQQAGRTVQLLALRGASADHPTAPAHAEGRYLKVAILRVTSRG
ncbi:MAG: class I SAM-dependent rRNA methyltransferase [Deltaproteobacteria bacterium]|nr:class I SAM-dependent rRNA methyltransferase [Deltaproteobacteria bacterium]